jgi:FkbM family methyltransferase
VFVSYAQNFEDVMLWRALKHVDEGFYIDIGAFDPVIDSVSFAFYQHGWRGVHIEPSLAYAEKLRHARPDEEVIEAAVGLNGPYVRFYILQDGLSTGLAEIAAKYRTVGIESRETKVPCVTLASVLDRHGHREIHWLKIDVEGMEKHVIESWEPSEVRPWVLVIESTLPLEPVACHQAWEPMVLSLGYEFAYFDGVNRYYVSVVHRELKDVFLTSPNFFDDFALSGTSGNFCRLLHQQLAVMRSEIEKHRKTVVHLRQSFDLISSLPSSHTYPMTGDGLMAASESTIIDSDLPPFTSTLEELLCCRGQQFVLSAYRIILLRAPSPDEFSQALKQLAKGTSKLTMVAKLRLTHEGQDCAVDLPGLARIVRHYRKGRLPLIGWLFRLWYRNEDKHLIVVPYPQQKPSPVPPEVSNIYSQLRQAAATHARRYA